MSSRIDGRVLRRLAALVLCAMAPLQAGVVYVNAGATGRNDGSSWQDAYVDLQDALSVVVRGDDVWVAAGVYLPDRGTGDPDDSFVLVDGVGLYGGFEGTESSVHQRNRLMYPTILSGDLRSNDLANFTNREDNTLRILVGERLGSGCVIDGLVVSGANGAGLCGSAIHLIDSSPRIVQCSVNENVSIDPLFASLGAAVCIEGKSAPTLVDTEIAGNRAYLSAGVLIDDQAAPVFTECVFKSNSAVSSVGALDIRGSSTPVFLQCAFVGNSGLAFSGCCRVSEGAAPRFSDCLFAGNLVEQEEGGCVAIVAPSAPRFERCTFVANESAEGGSAISITAGPFVPEAAPIVQSCILWGNEASTPAIAVQEAQILLGVSAKVDICYSVVEGWTGDLGGVGNNGFDPMFVDPFGEDGVQGSGDENWSPGFASLMIDLGDPLDLPVGVDIEGFPRLLDGNLDGVMRIDPGAFEAHHVGLGVTGDAVPGGILDVSVKGTPGLFGAVVFARRPGARLLAPFGVTLVKLSEALVRVVVGPLPSRITVPVPRWVPTPLELTVQALAVDPVSGSGNLSNAVSLRIE